MPIVYGPSLPPIPTGLSVLDVLILREDLQEDTVQVVLKLFANAAAGNGSVINVKAPAYGAVGDSIQNDTAAIEAAFAAAAAATTGTYSPTVFFPDGDYRITRPIWVPNRVTVLGQSREGTHIQYPSGYSGHSLIFTDDYDVRPGGPQYTTGFGGHALQFAYDSEDENSQWYVDVTQYSPVRLTGNWTIRFDWRAASAGAALDGYILYCGAYEGATGFSGYGGDHRVVQFSLATGVLKFRFRYGGASIERTVNTSATIAGAVNGQTWYNIEASYNASTHVFRVFVNGAKWSDGDYTPAAGDGSHFRHFSWERLCIGTGAPGFPNNHNVAFEYLAGAMKEFAVCSDVKHTSAFTPSVSFSTENDPQTLIYLPFAETYKGLLKGIGYAGTTVVYLAPTCDRTDEHSGIRILNLHLTGGSGVLGSFASNLLMFNVLHHSPGDGWQFRQNGYFSNFAYCDVVAQTGRVGIDFGSLSYGSAIGCKSSGAIPYCGNGPNLDMIGCTATVDGESLTGFFLGAGTINMSMCQVDAENAVTGNFIAPAVLYDCLGGVVRGCTFYPPPSGAGAVSAVMILNSNAGSRYKFDACFLQPSVGQPLFEVVGAGSLGRPIICNNPYNPLDAALCADADAVVDIDAAVLDMLGLL